MKWYTWITGTGAAVLVALAGLAVPPLGLISAAAAAKLLLGATALGVLAKSPLPH